MELLSFIPSILGGIGSMFGQPSTPQVPQLPGQQQAGQNILDTNAGMSNVPAELMPLYRSLTQSLANNPYATQAQQGANDASQMGMHTAGQAAGNADQLSGLAGSLAPLMGQYTQSAFDPQNALYDRTLHDVQQQQRVGQSARGIAMSPYGAGLEGDATRNFNIDWQNQQLGRQTQGIGGLGQLLQSIMGGFGGAASLGQGASGLMGQSASLPYQSFLGQGQDMQGILNAFGQAGQNANVTPQAQITNNQNYLGGANTANNTAINAAGQSFGQNQTLGRGLGSSLSGLFGTPGSGQNFFSTLFGQGQTGMLY